MKQSQHIDPNEAFPIRHKSMCFIKNVVTAPNVSIGDYTYYDDLVEPESFERNNILFRLSCFSGLNGGIWILFLLLTPYRCYAILI